jgi:hypothetical protein
MRFILSLFFLLFLVFSLRAEDSPECNAHWTLTVQQNLRADVVPVVVEAFRYLAANGMTFRDKAEILLEVGDPTARPHCEWDRKRSCWVVTIPVLGTRKYSQIMFQLSHEIGHAWLVSSRAEASAQQAEAFCSWLSWGSVEFLAEQWRKNPREPKEAFLRYVAEELDDYNNRNVLRLSKELKTTAAGIRRRKLADMNHDEACFFGYVSRAKSRDEALRLFGIAVRDARK